MKYFHGEEYLITDSLCVPHSLKRGGGGERKTFTGVCWPFDAAAINVYSFLHPLSVGCLQPTVMFGSLGRMKCTEVIYESNRKGPAQLHLIQGEMDFFFFFHKGYMTIY